MAPVVIRHPTMGTVYVNDASVAREFLADMRRADSSGVTMRRSAATEDVPGGLSRNRGLSFVKSQRELHAEDFRCDSPSQPPRGEAKALTK